MILHVRFALTNRWYHGMIHPRIFGKQNVMTRAFLSLLQRPLPRHLEQQQRQQCERPPLECAKLEHADFFWDGEWIDSINMSVLSSDPRPNLKS
jgi:hypothetical protein